MEIEICQKMISIGDKYQILINGKEAYFASSKLFRLFPEIHMFEFDSNMPKYIIKKRLSYLSVEYDIITQKQEMLQFRTGNYLRGHYYCWVGRDQYDIYSHKGRKYSTYKNGVQVAWWDKNSVTLFKGDQYKVIADNECDHDLIISFCLIIDNCFYKGGGFSRFRAAIDFGNIGPEEKKFDPEWRKK